MNNSTTTREGPPALVYLSAKRYIYLGQVQLRMNESHSGTSRLLVCISGSVKFQLREDTRWVAAKSILIPAGSKISIDNQGAVISICYLDSAKPDFVFLKKQMNSICKGIYFNHKNEDQLSLSIRKLRDDKPCFAEAQRRMEEIIYQGADPKLISIDSRIKYIVERLRDTAAQNISVKSLAEEVGISESGLIKIFRQNIGAPIRKHRIWYRLVNFLILTVSGVPTAVGMKQAGFTDAAHLSRCYSGLFGMHFSYVSSRKINAKYLLEDGTEKYLSEGLKPSQNL